MQQQANLIAGEAAYRRDSMMADGKATHTLCPDEGILHVIDNTIIARKSV